MRPFFYFKMFGPRAIHAVGMIEKLNGTIYGFYPKNA